MKRGLLKGLLVGVVPLAFIAAGGVIISGARMSDALRETVESALRQNGESWAAVKMDGRDVIITGIAPSQAAVKKALTLAHDIKGVRRVLTENIAVRLADPTVRHVATNTAPLRISGTWPEAAGVRLQVSLAGRSYVLGRDAALSSDGHGHWTLLLKDLPPEGVHDVVVTVVDGAITARDASRDELVIDTTPPRAPTLKAVTVGPKGLVLTGEWPAADARALVVTVAGRQYVLGKSPELTAQDDAWRLTIPKLPEDGRYDVSITVADALGNARSVVRKGAVIVDTTPPDVAKLSIDRAEADAAGRVRIEGRWPAGDAVSLRARLAGHEYVAGRTGDEFVVTADGHYRLTPKTPLPPGEHALVLTVQDVAGNVAERTFPHAVTVKKEKPKPVPAKPERPAAASTAPSQAERMTEKTTPPKDVTPPAPPTVKPLASRNRLPEITGTWPADDAVALEITLDGKTYRAGIDPELKTQGDTWRLKPSTPLKDGRHDVMVTVKDAAGNVAHDESHGEILIDGTSPAPPHVHPLATLQPRPVITGTWPEVDATRLEVRIAGKKYVLGASGSPLVSDGKGHWRLALSDPLAPGIYDVEVIATDAMGNVARDQTRNELRIKAPPKVVKEKEADKTAAAAEKAKLACQKQVDALLQNTKIHFESDSDKLKPESHALLARVAKALNACPKAEVVIAGHTDSQGSATYNQALSERRAAAVAKALMAQGVSADRLSVIGFGENRPIADNTTEEGRARNRRIEFYVRPRP